MQTGLLNCWFTELDLLTILAIQSCFCFFNTHKNWHIKIKNVAFCVVICSNSTSKKCKILFACYLAGICICALFVLSIPACPTKMLPLISEWVVAAAPPFTFNIKSSNWAACTVIFWRFSWVTVMFLNKHYKYVVIVSRLGKGKTTTKQKHSLKTGCCNI